MIFVTVGGQLPFNRLIAAADRYAAQTDEIVEAQTLTHDTWPALKAVHSLSGAQFREHCRTARVIVGHAGIGTFLTARELQKPLVLVPRRAALKEHRSDHQVDTAHALENHDGVQVVWDLDELPRILAKDLTPVSAVCESYQGLLSAVATAVA